MPPKTHSPIGASSASRWMNCPGSIALARDLPEQETPYAIEGTAAHTLAEAWLVGGDEVAASLETILVPSKFEGAVAHEVPVTQEMRDAVGVYVNTVRAMHAKYGGRLLVEQRFDLAELNPPEPGIWGTADTTIIAPRSLHVIDLKYGSGVVVEARGNSQLPVYALGAWLAAGKPEVEEITITIVQPRAEHPDGPVRSDSMTLGQLRVFGLDLIRAAWRAMENNGQTLVPGKWCRFCPAQGHCPALMKASQALAQVEFADLPLDRPPSPELLPLDVAADILSKAHILEEWLDALRARVRAELEAGRPVPGWKLVMKRANRSWVDEAEVAKWALEQELTDADMYKPRELKSPAQIEKLVGKGGIPEELVQKVSSGTTLAPAHDKRPEAVIGPALDFLAIPPGELTDQ